MSANQKKDSLFYLSVGATGIVYGDIGTSPLYAIKACFSGGHFPLNQMSVFGIISLIFWSVMIIVSLKYTLLIMRADNNGEGGVLALTALVLKKEHARKKRLFLYLGVIGASLFFGDSMITPAISVLSAMEGIVVVSPQLSDLVIPFAIIILILLFAAQKEGTGRIGVYFGPVMVIWFTVIGGLGIFHIMQHPMVLKALNPFYAVYFFYEHGWVAFASLGAVVLAVTGAEALYADMGHFGRPAIVRAWYFLVLPALICNYFGQAAVLLNNPGAISNPFYHLAPTWALIPMIVLSTIATVVASQSVISGMFSLTWQAVQMGYLPRIQVVHTSFQHIGQVFIPLMNWMLLISTIVLVLIFRTSESLAAAYGFSVVSVMVITCSLTSVLSYKSWGWSVKKISFIFGCLFFVDGTYFLSNALKFFDGGWLPILIAVLSFIIISTWIMGRHVLSEQLQPGPKTLKNFVRKISENPPTRTIGSGVYMTGTPNSIPTALIINFRHNHVLHEKIILLSIVTSDKPRVAKADRIEVFDLGYNIYQVIGHYGFMEVSNITSILEKCDEFGLLIIPSETSFFLSRGIPIAAMRPHMMRWRERLFIFLARNAMSATEFFKLPHNRVVELGIRYRI